MSVYKKAIILFFALFISIAQLTARYESQDQDDFDPMAGYPMSIMQSAREDLIRALYFTQQNNFESVPSLLQDALTKLTSRKVETDTDDDRNSIQNLIDKIDTIIQSLERTDRSILIVDLCQQLQASAVNF